MTNHHKHKRQWVRHKGTSSLGASADTMKEESDLLQHRMCQGSNAVMEHRARERRRIVVSPMLDGLSKKKKHECKSQKHLYSDPSRDRFRIKTFLRFALMLLHKQIENRSSLTDRLFATLFSIWHNSQIHVINRWSGNQARTETF